MKTGKQQKKDTLVIIGNGFDRWVGLDTSFDSFQRYYLGHRDAIMKRLRIKPILIFKGNEKIVISDVEIVYGDPCAPGELNDEFWHSFEMSLGEIDVYDLNMFFGKEKSDLRDLRKSIKNAKKILREAFCDWIKEIKLKEENLHLPFGDSCVYINFNYTNTLEKCFGIDAFDVFHIHGAAFDKESIIFGHSSHPQLPEPMLYNFGGRFRGLYLAQELLYKTDKHVQDNIQYLRFYMEINNIMCEDIKNIYVLGHSLASVDIEYFLYLYNITSEAHSLQKELQGEGKDSMGEFQLRVDYIVNTIGYGKNGDDLGREAIKRQFNREQEIRNKQLENKFYKTLKLKNEKHRDKGLSLVCQRQEGATWHLCCFTKKDKQRIATFMNEIGCKNYKLYSSIDECIKSI